MKRSWMLVGMILLVAGILFEEKHRAETHKSQVPIASLTQPGQGALESLPYSHFADDVNLWDGPPVSYEDTDLGYASLAFQSDLAPVNSELLRVQPDHKTEPVLTMLDREIAYALFASGGFSLTLKLKPEYPNQQALIPTRVDPGIGVNISF